MIYKIKRFSSNLNILNFKDVIKFLKNFPNLPFEVLKHEKSYGTGLTIMDRFRINDLEEFLYVIKTLVDKFKYQLLFVRINNGKLLKFKYDLFLQELKKGDYIDNLMMQPTTKIKVDNITQYTPQDTIFHMTDSSNLESILKNGFIPKGREYGLKGYNYPPCIHFLTDLYGLIRLEGNRIFGNGGWRTDDLILFEVNPPKNIEFLHDPACDFGIITYTKIDPEYIRLVDPNEYKNLFRKRSLTNKGWRERINPVLVKNITEN
jgi:hypothetical protein